MAKEEEAAFRAGSKKRQLSTSNDGDKMSTERPSESTATDQSGGHNSREDRSGAQNLRLVALATDIICNYP